MKHQGACVACHTATDSGLALAGSEEWVAEALVMFGVALRRAESVVDSCWLQPWRPMMVRCCADCAAPETVGVVAFGWLPVLHQ
jgi:hypothetical protein